MMMAAPAAHHADVLEEAMVKPLRRILTRAGNKPTPELPEGAQDASPGSPSPPISGCSDMSAPDRFCLRQQTAEAHTPSSKRTSLPAPLRMSRTESSLEPIPPTQTGSNRAQSISPADLDAAAAMLELPSAHQGSSSGGARGSNGGSSHDSDGGSAQAAPATAGSGARHATPEGLYAPDLHASIADASAESAAELLLAAGRLASVSSQHSRTEKSHSSMAYVLPTYNVLPSGAAEAAACATSVPADRHGRAYTPAAVPAAFIHPGAFDMAGSFPGAAEPLAQRFYYAQSTTGSPAAAAAAMYSTNMANRPVGCSCLKPCKPHTPCQQCGSPHSPGHTWRAGPAGPGTLCNACGTRYSRSKQKELAAAAAASFAAGGSIEMMLWSGSTGGSSAYTDGLAGSSGVGKSMKGGGKQGRASKVASSRVVKGSGGSRSSKGGVGTPYGVLAALERRWGAQSTSTQGLSVSRTQSGGGEGRGLEEQASFSEEQQAWMLQWHAAQQQYEQQYSQHKGQGEAGRTAGQQPDQQQQQQHWLAYSSWLQQQEEQQ